MISFSNFLLESGQVGQTNGEFVSTKGNIDLHFARRTTKKDNREYIQFLYAEPKQNAKPAEIKNANYIN